MARLEAAPLPPRHVFDRNIGADAVLVVQIDCVDGEFDRTPVGLLIHYGNERYWTNTVLYV